MFEGVGVGWGGGEGFRSHRCRGLLYARGARSRRWCGWWGRRGHWGRGGWELQ